MAIKKRVWTSPCDEFQFEVESHNNHITSISLLKDVSLAGSGDPIWGSVHSHNLSYEEVEELYKLLGEYVMEKDR